MRAAGAAELRSAAATTLHAPPAVAIGLRRCAVFPFGIPHAFFVKGKAHIRPVDGDGGIVFEPRDDDAASLAKFMLGSWTRTS